MKYVAVWAVPVCLAIGGILFGIASHDRQMGERSIFVMLSTIVVAILDLKLT